MPNTWILRVVLVVALGLTVKAASVEDIEFPSGVSLTTVDISTVPNPSEVADPKETGSYLFNADVDGEKKLSLNYGVKNFKSEKSKYFRAHPVFMTCLQKMRSHLDGEDKIGLKVTSGFKTAGEAGNSLEDQYARSGCGATVAFRTGAHVQDIAKAALIHCPPLFAAEQRDIGLIITANSLHIHMRGKKETEPYFKSNGSSMDDNTFKTWSLKKMDEAFDPQFTSKCVNYSPLAEGKTFPDGVTEPEKVVGKLDTIVTRDTTEDFKRLMQFPSQRTVFDSARMRAAWCGKQGVQCVDCSAGIKGQALGSRCADRVMSPRLYAKLQTLQKLVRNIIQGAELKVLSAWDEPYDKKPNGDHPATSLHKEGRAAMLDLHPSNPGQLQTLSKLAICAGLDYVHFKSSPTKHIFVAVKKQAEYEAQEVDFSSGRLLAVVPTYAEKETYELDSAFSATERKQMPLFDSDNQDSLKLGSYATLGMFKSVDEEFRYFRLDPRMVQCYEAIMFKENKYNNTEVVKVIVSQAYMSESEQKAKLDPLFDHRFNSFNLGQGMHLKYDNSLVETFASDFNGTVYNIHRLADVIVQKCSGIFFEEDNQFMGLGLYNDSVYVGIQEEFKVWVESEDLLPPGTTIKQYTDAMAQKFVLGVENRFIDPDDLEQACRRAVPPQKQSVDYVFVHSLAVREERARRTTLAPTTTTPQYTTPSQNSTSDNSTSQNFTTPQNSPTTSSPAVANAAASTTGSSEKCVPRRDTKFCVDTLEHRKRRMELLWKEVKRLHLHKNEAELKEAMEGCLGACGTCLTGEVWEDKLEHCNNFLHWIPFTLMNDMDSVLSNFYARDNIGLKHHACNEAGRHCPAQTPVFSQMAPHVDYLYRPNPRKSMEEELYSAADNPLPVYEIISRLYGIHAKGKVMFWVKDETEMSSLRSAMEVVMVYNKEVTGVEVMVEQGASVDAVSMVVEGMVLEWSKNSCPKYTREAITPYKVKPITEGRTKRAVDSHMIGDQLLMDRKNWERRWMEKSIGF